MTFIKKNHPPFAGQLTTAKGRCCACLYKRQIIPPLLSRIARHLTHFEWVVVFAPAGVISNVAAIMRVLLSIRAGEGKGASKCSAGGEFLAKLGASRLREV